MGGATARGVEEFKVHRVQKDENVLKNSRVEEFYKAKRLYTGSAWKTERKESRNSFAR